MRRQQQRFDPTGLLILVCWAYVVVPRLIQTFSAAKFRTTVSSGLPEGHLATLTERLLGVALLALCVTIVLQRARNLPSGRGLALLAVLAPWFYLETRDLYLGTRPRIETVLYPAVVLAVWALRPRLERLSLVGWLTAATALVGLAMGVFLRSKGILINASNNVVTPQKQILPWGILIGPFSDGNNFGQVLVLGLPAVGLIRGWGRRILMGGMIGFAILWTSSRSSLGAILLGGGLAIVLVRAHPITKRTLGRLGVLAAAALAVGLPLITHQDTAFTNRGEIWRVSLQVFRDAPWLGHGSAWYSQIGHYVNSLPATAFHGHNQFVQTVVVGGVVYLALTALMMGALIRAAGDWARDGYSYPLIYLTMFLVSATLEVSFGVVDRSFLALVTWLPMTFILFGERTPRLATITVRRSAGTAAALPPRGTRSIRV